MTERLADALLAELDAAGLDAESWAQTPQDLWWGPDGRLHLSRSCATGLGSSRPLAFSLPLGRLGGSGVAPTCTHCGTREQALTACRLDDRPLAEWLTVADRLSAELAGLDAHQDAAAFARAFGYLDELRVELAAHPAALTALADRMLGARALPLPTAPDDGELRCWARQWALADRSLAAPLLPGTTRAALTRLGGRAGVDVAFRRWAARRPGHRPAPGWGPWHEHWAALAASLPLGPPTMVTLASPSYHGTRLSQLRDAAGRERYALELAWLRPPGRVRVLPRLAVELLADAADDSCSRLAWAPGDDPAAVTVAEHLLAWGLPATSALDLAAATVAEPQRP